ncbi:MAG: TetR/AcrR family transcriptional regulator [Desulfovibrio sp.]
MARRQQEKSRQTKEELLVSAMSLFGRKGFAATTIAEITKEAGYAKGSFYSHWAGKDDIFLEILERKMGQYREERSRKIREAVTFEDCFDVIWDFLESIMDDMNWSKVFLEFTVHAARDDRLKAELNRSKYRLSNEIFKELIGDYVLADCAPEKIGSLNTALFEGFLIQNVLQTDVLSRQDVRRAALALAKAHCLGEQKRCDATAGTERENPESKE